MAYGQTVTAVSALTSATTSTAINVSKEDLDPVAIVAAASVTSGAVLKLQGADLAPDGTVGTYRDLGDPVTIAANGNTLVPIDRISPRKRPDKIRLNVTSRTDGSYTLSLVETPKQA